jgi:predicted site-specific integrase-resolvase
MQLLHKQKCDLTNQVKVLTEENKVLQHEIPQLHNEKLELTNQLKVIKQITEPY